MKSSDPILREAQQPALIGRLTVGDLNDIKEQGIYTFEPSTAQNFESSGKTYSTIPAPARDHIHDYLEWIEDTTAIQILSWTRSWYRACYICGVKKTTVFVEKEVKNV